MIKNLLLSACCLLSAATVFAVFTPAEKEFMNRRRAVKRERITIGTNEYWVVTYMRGAKLDSVKTNLAYRIEGVQQTNPTEEDARVIRDFMKTAYKTKLKDAQAWKNFTKVVEQLRDKSIHQESRDLMTSLLAILEQVPEA